jgi:Uma2 family endonuclease
MGPSPRSSARRLDLDAFEEMLLECPEDEKWELIDGRVVRSTVGARWEHNRIVLNIGAALLTKLRAADSQCRLFLETFRVRSAFHRLSVLPDVVVRCGALEASATSIDDPAAIVEVAGPGSDLRDKVTKLEQYRRLPSLRLYGIVERDEAKVVAHRRDAEGAWREHAPLTSLDDVVEFPEIGVAPTLAEIYRDLSSQS